MPAVHLLGDGRYSVWLTEAGMGRSSWLGTALTRWRGERLEDADGWRFWVRDRELGRSWTVMQPASWRAPGHGSLVSGPGAFAWSQRDHGIETRLEVCVAPGADAELRTVTLVNLGERPRRLDVTGCAELVLHDPLADASHPAFSKLFVQTAWEPATEALVATRRPRGHGERHPAIAHHVVGEGELQFDTDRARFLGRGHSWARPAGIAARRALAGVTGNVLDPVFATRRSVELASGEKKRVTFVLAAGVTRGDALASVARFRDASAIESAFSAAQAAARELHESLGLSPQDAEQAAALAGALLYGDPALSARLETAGEPGSDAAVRSSLGIPGSHAVVTVRCDEPGAAAEWETLARMHRHWRAHGIESALVALGAAPNLASRAPGVHVAASLEARARQALEAGARIAVTEATLARVKQPLEPGHGSDASGAARVESPPRRRPPRREREALRFENGHGGFSADGREYVVRLDALRHGGHRHPPLPWVNVIANAAFGTLVSESGAGFTWSGNSREHRLTPWSNDPLLDPHGETLHLLDPGSGLAWSPLPGPAPHPAAYEVRHGLGYSVFQLEAESLRHETLVTVDASLPVKLVRVRLTNRGEEPRALVLIWQAKLVLGPDETLARRTVTAFDAASGAMLARNPAAGAWSDAVAFARAVTGGAAELAHTTDRAAFLGRQGHAASPRALRVSAAWNGAAGPMHDPCFAWRVAFTLAPGESRDIAFVLGEGADEAQARALAELFSTPETVEASATAARERWRALVSRVQVETPVPELDLMVNGWLPYQTLSCRLWGRSAFYQSGGAYGFRDQLQDATSLLALDPDLARAQIVLNASHQFAEGDVLHWWHPPLSQGMRTRFADDLLWLPYLIATYLHMTGDRSVLEEPARFLAARELAPGEDEAYLVPRDAGERASVYEHAARAIDRSLAVGAHGLPLFGCGDWNDGMNRVGREGRGESVWMGWFLASLLGDWADLAESRDELARAGRWRAHRERLREALEAEAWDGDWYRRGWYDDGAPLGSKDSDECRIDALAQAWSVLSGVAPRERCVRAMASLERHLVSERDGLIRLLAPPFQDTPHDPGYIKGYVAGVRENGGQYTHAALWVVRAYAELGRRDRAAELLRMLSPVSHTHDAASVRRYQVEPYVVAADVYGVAPHVGRGGWTWYTGSSGWMYRVALESVLGVRMEGGQKLVVRPCIPDDWQGFTMSWTLPGTDGTHVQVVVRNPHGRAATVVAARYDGRPVRISDGEARVPLLRDGQRHVLEVELGPGSV
jgi:cyclic beta-1,2-glucan synthetase